MLEQLFGLLFVIYLVVTFLVSLARRANRGGQEEPWDTDVFPFPPDLREEPPAPEPSRLDGPPALDPDPDLAPNAGSPPKPQRTEARVPPQPAASSARGGGEKGLAMAAQAELDEAEFYLDADNDNFWDELERTDMRPQAVAAPEPVPAGRAQGRFLADRQALEDAILSREVLGPPRAVKPHRPLEWLRP